MDEQCNLQLQELRFIVKQHEKQHVIHDKLLKKQSALINAISKTLFQIKWMVIGALLITIASGMGLLPFAIKILGLMGI